MMRTMMPRPHRPLRRPYIPLGCDQQGRLRTGQRVPLRLVDDAYMRARARGNAAGVALAIVLGVLGALALIHYLTPCAAGSLC
jgi:hypothetical protein